jgi:hypothetical protein
VVFDIRLLEYLLQQIGFRHQVGIVGQSGHDGGIAGGVARNRLVVLADEDFRKQQKLDEEVGDAPEFGGGADSPLLCDLIGPLRQFPPQTRKLGLSFRRGSVSGIR